jgi:hypothetical protein
MGIFDSGRYRYIGGGKGKPWQMFDKHSGKLVKTISFKEAKARFYKAYDNKLITKIMRRQGMKGKDGRKVAKGLVRAYRLGIIGADALY